MNTDLTVDSHVKILKSGLTEKMSYKFMHKLEFYYYVKAFNDVLFQRQNEKFILFGCLKYRQKINFIFMLWKDKYKAIIIWKKGLFPEEMFNWNK